MCYADYIAATQSSITVRKEKRSSFSLCMYNTFEEQNTSVKKVTYEIEHGHRTSARYVALTDTTLA